MILRLKKNWIEFRFTPKMNWSNIEIDHVKPICMFNVSDDEEIKLAFNWKNTQPLLEEAHSQKSVEFSFLDYQIQFIKTYQSLKMNEERQRNFSLMRYSLLHLKIINQQTRHQSNLLIILVPQTYWI